MTPSASPEPRTSRTDPGLDKLETLDALDALDAALIEVRRIWQRPGYRSRLLSMLGTPVSFATLRVLRAVENAAESTPSIADVADRLAIDPSTASRLVDQQVDAGWVERTRDPTDGRRAALSLTGEGERLLSQVTAARRALLADATADWDADDLQRLHELLERLQHDFERIEADL